MIINFIGYDRQLGIGLLTLSSISLIYYTLWIIVIPMVNEKHIIRQFFPRESMALALGIPVGIGSAFFLFVAVFAFIKMRNI
ncbi:unnamed protein product [Oppiella nova]|uniref:Dolichol phosphate-mannose biosynthesis regulatory protein n=1 Tax=Oppiella nova TaxID=334625 RepID=A0A7R9MMG3_9ACAR|nr:unnamed protein product [Oppiella nova]CAG2180172.1 unnamed protein product [Oppiella nova]